MALTMPLRRLMIQTFGRSSNQPIAARALEEREPWTALAEVPLRHCTDPRAEGVPGKMRNPNQHP